MESGSMAIDFAPGIPPLVLKIEEGKSSSNVRDIAGAALVLEKADRSPAPGLVEFLQEWTKMEDTKEFEATKKKASETPNQEHGHYKK